MNQNQVTEHNNIFDSIMEMQEHAIDSNCLILLSSIENASYYVTNYLTIVQDTMTTNYNTDEQIFAEVHSVVDGQLSETITGRATLTKGKKDQRTRERYICRTSSSSYHGTSYEDIGSSQSHLKVKTSYVVGVINVGFLKGLFTISGINLPFTCGVSIMGSVMQVTSSIVSSECYMFRNMLGLYINESFRRYLRLKTPQKIPQIFVPSSLAAPAPAPAPASNIDHDFLGFYTGLEFHHGRIITLKTNTEQYQ